MIQPAFLRSLFEDQLMAALERATTADLEIVQENQTVGEHLVEYAVHESFHAGQLELLNKWRTN